MPKNAAAERTRRLAESPIPSLLLRLSLPAVVGMLTAGVYNLVDRVFVGRAVGVDGLTGVAVALPYMLLLVATGMLVGFGAATQISIKLGEKKTEEAERVLGSATLMLTVLSLILTAVGLLLLNPIFSLFNVSDAVRPHARGYLEIIVFATGFQLVGYGLNSAIRAEGNTRTAMWTLLIGILLNCPLAWVFLFIFHWGVRGAALATAISQAVSAVWVLAYFLRGKSALKLRWSNLRFDVPECSKILVLGSPMFLRQVATVTTYGMMIYQVGRYGKQSPYGGDIAVAAWVSIYSLLMIIAFAVFGINQGTQPVVGFNFGSKRFDRVKQALLCGIGYAACADLPGLCRGYLLRRRF